MITATLNPLTGTAAASLACERIAPLWPLRNFVAVNPFVGLSRMPFEDANRLMEQGTHRGILMDADYYQEQLGANAPADFSRREEFTRILTVADWLDRAGTSNWASFITDEISKWCSSYYDEAEGLWRMPWRGLPLYEAWKSAAAKDANPEVYGLAGFRHFATALPDSAEAMIEYAMEQLEVEEHLATDFLHRQLMSIFGWSAYAAYHDRQSGTTRDRQDLLAIRLAYDLALRPLASGWSARCPTRGTSEAQYLAQSALEDNYQTTLINALRPAVSTPARKELQAVFCIDVRSEPYRRALEAQSTAIQTIGFAGFFGMAVEFAGSPRCPVLLKPRHRVQTATAAGSLSVEIRKRWKSLTHSAAACFSSVEAGGLWFLFELLWQMLPSGSAQETPAPLHWEIPLAQRADMVQDALRNMSLDASGLAPVVLLCGHGSRSLNNPYSSSLDCGACGGNRGDINARFAAALMNDREVRAELQKRGISIPEDTVFVSGMHITTTNEVVLYDAERLTEAQQRQLKAWLKAASEQCRLPGNPVDWSEVRPEWGLAGNAAFIAAPRSMTRGVNLGGRVFLHDYDPAADLDGSVLKLILNAPAIVASWINLQYYASTVNNQLFGSGNKVLHNVVGGFGVWEGNAGDLRTGLPLQSLHDGTRWVHEPIRLQIYVAANPGQIDTILLESEDIRNLVENQWVRLYAIGDETTWKCRKTGNWTPV